MHTAIRTLACAGALLAFMPAVANADLTIGGSGPSTLTGSCAYTVTTANQTIDGTDIAQCVENGSGFSVNDDVSGENVDLDSLAISSCAGPISVESGSGGVVVAGPIDLSGSGCSLDLEAPTGAITQTAAIETPTLTTSSSGATNLTSTSNAVANLNANSSSSSVEFSDAGALTVTGLSAGTNAYLDTSAGGVTFSGPTSVPSGTLSVEPVGAITQSAPIEAETFVAGTAAEGSITLTNPSNAITSFTGTAYSDRVDLDDSVPTLSAAVNGSAGVGIANTGNIDISEMAASGDPVTLTASGGDVTQVGGQLSASSLTIDGDAVSLSGTSNEITGDFDADASDGAVSARFSQTNVLLGTIQASGGVTISDSHSPGSLQPTGPISGSSISLSGDGITAASGSLAELEAPSVTISDGDADEAWTITPGTLMTAEGAGSIAYSGATSLSVTGGESFDVTPSSSTALDVTASGTNSGSLTYNAGGATVTGTTSPPSGTIDGSGLQPVSFGEMATVNVLGAATPPPDGNGSGNPTPTPSPTPSPTPTPTSTPTPAPPSTPTPSCSLKLASDRIKVPKRVRGRRKGKATLTAIVTCSEAEHMTVGGSITVVTHPKHGKSHRRSYKLAGTTGTASVGATTRITLSMPAAVEAAVGTTDKLSGSFTLVAGSGTGFKAVTLTAPRLT